MGGSEGRGQMQVVSARRLGKKGQEQARETKMQETRQVCAQGRDPADREKKGCRCRCWGHLSRRGGRAPGAGGGPGLDPGKHRRGRRGASGQGGPLLFEKAGGATG